MLTWQPEDSPIPGSGIPGRGEPLRPARGRIAVLSALVVAMVLFYRPRAASGTSLARLDMEQMAARAAAVVRARCIAQESRADASGLWTLTTFERRESWKGSTPPRFAVLLPGGAAGGRRETVEGAPRFTAGEEVVLFLERLRGGEWTIVGWVQGTYRIQRDPRSGAERAVPDAAGMLLFDAQAKSFRLSEGQVLPIAQLRALVAHLAQRGGQ